MDNTFIRESFYLDPPKEGSSEKEWKDWINKDNRKAAAAKAKHTKSIQHEDVPEEFQQSSILKSNGVWRQSTAIGFGGSFEEGEGRLERPVEADQEKVISIYRMENGRHKRGGTREGKSARRRANRRKRK